MLEFLSLNFANDLTFLVIVFLLIFSLFLIDKNKKLKEELKNLKLNDESNSRKIDFNEDMIAMDVISKSNVLDEKDSVKSKNTSVNKYSNVSKKSKPYSKNVLLNSSKVTSPIGIGVDKAGSNSSEFVDNKIEINKKSKDYLEELSLKMESFVEPQTVTLTNYEQEQEDNAVISYKELLNLSKNKMVDNVLDEETGEFIEELKKFRNSLN